MGCGWTHKRMSRDPLQPLLWGPKASGHPCAWSPLWCWRWGEQPALSWSPRRGWGLQSHVPSTSRHSLAHGLPLLPPLCSFTLRLHPHCFLLPACTTGCIWAPHWGAPKYSHVGNNSTGAKLQAQPRGHGLEERVAQSIPKDVGLQHPDAVGLMTLAWAAGLCEGSVRTGRACPRASHPIAAPSLPGARVAGARPGPGRHFLTLLISN